MLRGCQLGQTAAVSGYRCQNCGKRCWHIWLLRLRRREFFPRASERRVLPIVGVCISSSHLHIFSTSHILIFTSSHILIFTSAHLHIFTSSHPHIFTSSHPHIFTSSHLHIFSSCLLALLPSHLHIFTSSPLVLLPSPSFLFLFWRLGQGQCRRDGTKYPFARNEVRSPKTGV